MEPLLAAMPAVKSPEGHVHFKNKLIWTLAILILYFALTNIPLFGIAPTTRIYLPHGGHSLPVQAVQSFTSVSGLSSRHPSCFSSLKGADILHIDTSETRGQVMYMGLQKILIMVMIVIEAAPNLVGGFIQPIRSLPASSLAATCLPYPSSSSSRSVSAVS